MRILDSLKSAASDLLDSASGYLDKAADTARSYSSNNKSKQESEQDVLDILNNLVFKKHQYNKASELCDKHIYDDDPEIVAGVCFYRSVCYQHSAQEMREEIFQAEENYIDNLIEQGKDTTYDEDKEHERQVKPRVDERIEILEHALKDVEESIRLCEENPDININWELLIYQKADVLDNLIASMPFYNYNVEIRLRYGQEARRWAIRALNGNWHQDVLELYNRSTVALFGEQGQSIGEYDRFLEADEKINNYREYLTKSGKDEAFISKTILNYCLEIEKMKFTIRNTFSERQFIFIVKDVNKIAGCFDEDGIINHVFTVDKIPADLTFPAGHPQANTLYVAHPAQMGAYLPYENAETTIFHDKVEEFCRLAQCLGAREITFNSIKGEAISESLTSHLNVGGGVGVKGNCVEESYGGSKSSSMSSERRENVGYSYVFNPTVAPYVPDDIHWLDVDKSWQTFVKQRIEGNMLSYNKKISSSEAVNVSRNLANSVKASFKNMMLNVNANYDADEDTTFSHSQESEWEIQIQFVPLSELAEPDKSSEKLVETTPAAAIPEVLTDAEEKYKEEVLFILEDGEITDTERRFLERKRVKLGVSEERAAEIEVSCKPSLTEAEKEYLEIYKELVGDSEITDRKRRMLDREAESLGITPERVGELESKSL